MNRPAGSRDRGFTRYEAVVTVVIVVALLIVALGIFLPALHRARNGAKQIRDATQVRDFHRGLVLWSRANDGGYPIPSQIDRSNSTVALEADAQRKDSTGAIASVLAFNELVVVDELISLAERSQQFGVDADFAKRNPGAAVDPEMARWDPAFRGTPSRFPDGSAVLGNLSYAVGSHVGEGRRGAWRWTEDPSLPILGNRGAEVVDGAWNAERQVDHVRLVGGPTGTENITMLIHGSKNTWEGNIAYNDNHVSFETSMAPDGVLYRVITGGQTTDVGDCLFLDEADPASGTPLPDTRDHNIFLGLFERGPTQAELDGRVSGYLKAAAWYDGQDP